MQMDPQLELLKPRPVLRHKPKTCKNLRETQDVKVFFKSRHVQNTGLARALNVTKQAIGLWWKKGIPEHRLPEVQELMCKIVDWERSNNCRFPG